MTLRFHPHFPHRCNHNGTFDSICIECFQTVATEIEEADLTPHESVHICDGFSLGKMLHPELHRQIAD
jgi:hypothetical protein